MADIQPHLPVKLFVGVLTSLPDSVPKAEKQLVELFGDIDLRSDSFPFDATRYYDQTMGAPIYRNFLAFTELIDPSTVAQVKGKTNNIESMIGRDYTNPQRPINLDPGYLEQSKVVLASTKNFYHRILLSRGIYAEVTLHYKAGQWNSFPWTFPDYKTGRYFPFFSSLRDIYRNQLKEMGYKIRLR